VITRARIARFVPQPLKRPARLVLAVAAFAFRRGAGALLKIWNGVGYVRNGLPSPQMYWPDIKGLESALLVPSLVLLQFHHQALRALVAQCGHLRRWRRPRAPATCRTVLHVTCSFDLGGTQRQIMYLCEHQVAGSFQHEAIELFPEQNYLYRQNVRLQPERYKGRTLASRIMWRLIQHAGTRSAQVVQVYKLAKDFRALRPDIVVGWGHEIGTLTFLAAAIARVPHIVFCIRTFNPAFGWTTTKMGNLLKSSHRRMVPLLSGIVTNSTVLSVDYTTWLSSQTPEIHVCPNGISVDAASVDAHQRRRAGVRKRFDIPAEAVVLMNVGRFSAEKGQLTLMRANRRLVARYGDRAPICLLCGDGPLLPEVRQFVKENGFGNIRFAGRIDDVDEYLCAADIFVMPSDFEGMPNAMMEAMGHGLPCVSTDRTGAVDIARNGIEALYCPVGADDTLAAHLSTLIDDPTERARLGANARERIREFSVERMTNEFNSCLRSMLNQSPAVQTAARSQVPQLDKSLAPTRRHS